ncbi:uncharacterized protein N0V96_001788 [Colletotrichum fioriniae]|uniref:uncharacterized protein n=1 Tax=Colletotrichum fioriniae TaxID=710243 RepID=UPI0032DA28DA|nr:hypothetical protein N0V96_001788 [Colletotrichum fioriniae]
MAVIDGLPEIKVSIRINGSEEDCIEYDDPDPPKSASSRGSATHTISKVIESQVDAGFSIHQEIRNRRSWINGKNWLALHLHIDGQYITTSYRGPDSLVNQTIVSTTDKFGDKYTTPGKKIKRHFKFASIRTVEGDNEELSGNQTVPEHLGIIEVAVFRVKLEGWEPRTSAQARKTVANLPLADIMRLAQERLEQLEPHVKREPGTGVKREADEETNSRPRKIYKVDADGIIDLSDD